MNATAAQAVTELEFEWRMAVRDAERGLPNRGRLRSARRDPRGRSERDRVRVAPVEAAVPGSLTGCQNGERGPVTLVGRELFSSFAGRGGGGGGGGGAGIHFLIV